MACLIDRHLEEGWMLQTGLLADRAEGHNKPPFQGQRMGPVATTTGHRLSSYRAAISNTDIAIVQYTLNCYLWDWYKVLQGSHV